MCWNPWNRAPASRNGFMSKVPVDQLGMKVLYEGSHVDVDIVAVHGLGAIPDITWRETTSKVNWLRDKDMLPGAIPNSRIMCFGYDSLWFCRDPVRTRAETISNTLLAHLQHHRQNCRDRPVIFIGHCFGGLVIQKALTLDYLKNDFNSTLLSTIAGIIFLGTPHSGTVTSAHERISHSNLISLLLATSDFRLDKEVLKNLGPSHNTLTDISKDFLQVCAARYNALMVINFFEQRSSNVGKLFGRNGIQEFVVGEASATLGHYPSYGLPLDHYSLNKFASPDDGNFKLILGLTKEIYSRALTNTVEIPLAAALPALSIETPSPTHIVPSTKSPSPAPAPPISAAPTPPSPSPSPSPAPPTPIPPSSAPPAPTPALPIGTPSPTPIVFSSISPSSPYAPYLSPYSSSYSPPNSPLYSPLYSPPYSPPYSPYSSPYSPYSPPQLSGSSSAHSRLPSPVLAIEPSLGYRSSPFNFLISYDLSYPPSQATVLSSSTPTPKELSPSELGRPATYPPVSEMYITCSIFPWTITVSPFPSDHNILTVSDVLQSLFRSLQMPVTQEEWNAKGSSAQRNIYQAWSHRLECEKTQEDKQRERGCGVRRIDLLVNLTVFQGLEFVKGSKNAWVLHVRKAISL